MTRPGIEVGRNITGRRRVTSTPTRGTALDLQTVTVDCNECNEALRGAREAVTDARRLALVAENALANGDLQRARSALRDLHDACETAGLSSARALVHDVPQ